VTDKLKMCVVHWWRMNRSTRRKTRSTATSSTINAGWIGLGSNPGLHIERPTTTATEYRKQSYCCAQEHRCNLANNTGVKGAGAFDPLTSPPTSYAYSREVTCYVASYSNRFFFVLWLSVGSLIVPSKSTQTFSTYILSSYLSIWPLQSTCIKFYV
jgi:hypothetical protein